MKIELITDSIANNIRIGTFILEYPRLCHSELMTHRVFSRNSASSRAIPTKAIIANLREDPADIVWWGKQMTGMQAKEQLSGMQLLAAKALWRIGMEIAIIGARLFAAAGLHKQIANRILETFQNIRVVVTSTEWNNFLALRDHPDAQPELAAVAREIAQLLKYSEPHPLKPGQWHMPYIDVHYVNGEQQFFVWQEGDVQHKQVTLTEALKISASMAAQESYRKSDASLGKAQNIFDRLINSAPVHASPTEHQAMAMLQPKLKGMITDSGWEDGATHVDRDRNFWSGNFRGWIQHRQLIPNHHVPG